MPGNSATGRSTSSMPCSSRHRSTAVAVNVLVIDPIEQMVSAAQPAPRAAINGPSRRVSAATTAPARFLGFSRWKFVICVTTSSHHVGRRLGDIFLTSLDERQPGAKRIRDDRQPAERRVLRRLDDFAPVLDRDGHGMIGLRHLEVDEPRGIAPVGALLVSHAENARGLLAVDAQLNVVEAGERPLGLDAEHVFEELGGGRWIAAGELGPADRAWLVEDLAARQGNALPQAEAPARRILDDRSLAAGRFLGRSHYRAAGGGNRARCGGDIVAGEVDGPARLPFGLALDEAS